MKQKAQDLVPWDIFSLPDAKAPYRYIMGIDCLYDFSGGYFYTLANNHFQRFKNSNLDIIYYGNINTLNKQS